MPPSWKAPLIRPPTAAVPCAQALAIIGQLYGIERAASDRHLDAPARQRLRQKEERPLLAKLQAYLQEQQAAALPKSPLGAAIGYALRNWVALTRYAEDGRAQDRQQRGGAGATSDRARP
jgi:hypothetical protein